MRVLTYVEAGKLEWREAADPRIEGDGQAIVRPVASSACDLDRAIVAGRTPFGGPFALGHECVAEVVEAGPAVRRVARGQLVVVPWHICCGACDRCRAGLTASCAEVTPNAMYGIPIAGEWGGLFSDLVRVPFADAMLVPVPPGVRPAAVACASDNLTDAWEAVSGALRGRPGARVLVLGGPFSIALYAVQCAVAAGAAEVVYVDRSPERLALAASLGARPLAREGSDPLGEFPVVIEAAVNPDELVRGLKAVGPGGACTSLSIYFSDLSLPVFDMLAKDVTFRIRRCSVGPRIAEVLALVAEGKLAPERVTSREASFDDAIEVLTSRSGIKPVLVRGSETGGPRP